MGEREYYAEILGDVKASRPDLLGAIRRVLEYQLGCGECDWTALDVRLPPSRVRQLVDLGLVERTGKHRYRVKSPEALREAAEELGILSRPRGSRGPAFNVGPDIFEGVVGYEDVKRVIIMALRARAPVHVLLIGPPGIGKSLFLDSVREALEARGECVAHVEGGKGLTTSVGLVEVLLQFPPDTPCLLTIDELDKMGRADMSALYRVMTTGEVVLAKHRTIVREKRLVWVLAASNREKAIPAPILSRFMRIRFRPLSREEYEAIVPAILEKREGVPRELAEYIARRLAPITRDPRDAIRVARMAWTREDVDWVVEKLFGAPSRRG